MTLPGQKKPTTMRVVLILGSIFLFVGLIIAATLMGNPYFAIAQVALFCLIVILTGFQLRRCFLAAKGTVIATTLMTVTFFFFLCGRRSRRVGRFWDVFESENKDYVRPPTP
jgi:cell division protein FtsW (lipid II flippase)